MAQTPYPRSDRELIRRIERSPGHRAGYKQLVREFGLGGGRERRLLLEQLARITARGELVKIDTEQWSIPAAVPEKNSSSATYSAARWIVRSLTWIPSSWQIWMTLSRPRRAMFAMP